MANIVNCKNKLLKNNYYFALSTSNVSNPTKLLANLTGIANSGAKCFYFTPDALVVDFDRTAPTVGVCVPTARAICGLLYSGFSASSSARFDARA